MCLRLVALTGNASLPHGFNVALHANMSVLWGLFCFDTPVEQIGMEDAPKS